MVDKQLLELIKQHPEPEKLTRYLLDNYGWYGIGDEDACCSNTELFEYSLPTIEEL